MSPVHAIAPSAPDSPATLRATGALFLVALFGPAGSIGLIGMGACSSLHASTEPSDSGQDRSGSSDGPALALIEERARQSIEPSPPLQPGHLLLTGATLLTAAGSTHAPGWLYVVDGRIAALGSDRPPVGLVSPGATTLDLAGRFVTPGLIDAHSHLGVYPSPPLSANRDGNELTNPNTAGVWAEHGFWPGDPGLVRALEGGVTTIHVLPGSGNLIGGRGVTLSLRLARGARAMRFPGAPDTVKMACGENPKRVYGGKGGAPMTRMGNVRGYREAFANARKWLRENAKKDASELPRDLAMESLAGILEGRILAQVHCYTAQDMLGFLGVADEFGFEVRAFHHALEAYKVRDILAKKNIGVATWADWWGFKLEAWDTIDEAPALLSESNVRIAIHSDSSEGIQRLNQEAAKAFFNGRARGVAVDRDEALRWVTYNPAWMLGIEHEAGSLEPGKRADLVVWDKDPFSVYARAEKVWVGGELVIDRVTGQKPRVDFSLGHPERDPTYGPGASR